METYLHSAILLSKHHI
ncbi:UNVERIFIED_CONTAM: hypothetical protein GTU68_003381 [Idotea baltica]|nr:hypothetical protein [Idotea baltica]